MKIAFVLPVLLTGLLHARTAMGVGFRSLKSNNNGNGNGDDFDENADPLLEEVTTADGAVVAFYEADAGALVVVSTTEGNATDPLSDYQQVTSGEGKKKDFAEFYEYITGKKADGRIKKAINRQKKNKEKEAERNDWEYAEEDSQLDPVDVDDSNEHGDGNRKLSADWWIRSACNSFFPYDWCDCMTYKTGNAWKIKTSDDFFHKVHLYRGDNIVQQIDYYKCTGYWPFRNCGWHYLNSRVVYRGQTSLIWGSSGGSWKYKGFLKNVAWQDDAYHLTFYDEADIGHACMADGLGCYTCPNIW